MSKFVVVTFSEEAKAYKGVSALSELHDEGSITLYATVVAQREADGKLAIKQRIPDVPLSAGFGSLVGGLIGVFGGPVGVAIGMVAGGAAGGLGDFVSTEVSDEFLGDVTKALAPGMFAVLAEVSERWNAPIDTRMEALGGTVLREERADVFEAIMERRAEAGRTALEAKKAAWQTRRAEKMEARLEKEIADARNKLLRTAEKAKKSLDETTKEMEAKLCTLEAQAAKAKPEAKKQITDRITEIKGEIGEREKKLLHAWNVAREALR